MNSKLTLPSKAIIGIILTVALISFEIFNFDTTRFALDSLLGDMKFAGVTWAVILAVAFCAIDFAGLVRIFTPQTGRDEPKFVWYLMGAWLLGATMNAIMTWWAVNLTLLSQNFGNEVLGRTELLRAVPLFVAILVWLTRILFIGAFSVAGDYLFADAPRQRSQPRRSAVSRRKPAQAAPNLRLVRNQGPSQHRPQYVAKPKQPEAPSSPSIRPTRQPPMPNRKRTVPLGLQARKHRR